ncbi:MAG: SDR family NAD(P)-dependent oxidoreductase [Clostridia bacterium]|nr:SDR family NAD(P)-dependent oxidoreductase [Clostridia bacterium]
MREVCVITGGGSGMGLAAARCMPKEKIIVLSGRTVQKLEKAVKELEALGYEAHPFACDTSKRESVRKMAEYAASLGNVRNVINAAGLSPAMAKPEQLLRVNALGTVNVNQEFSKVMRPGSVIVDVSSNSAYVLPDFMVGKASLRRAEQDPEGFVRKFLRLCSLVPGEYQKSGLAYALSKKFVCKYAQMCAFAYGEKGIRVVSLSPGLIATDMGNLEAGEGGKMLQFTAEQRMGTPEELGYALATLADERNGYLCGVDVLADGGATYGKKFGKSKVH